MRTCASRPLAVAAWALLLAALSLGIRSAASRPTVYRTWPDGRCVAVLGRGDCASPPAVHRTVWVGQVGGVSPRAAAREGFAR